MGKPNFKNRGYSLVELLVVMAVIGAVAGVAFFGSRSFNNTTAVSNASKEFVTNLRAVQNRVDNGQVLENGKVVQEVTIPANGSAYYSVNGTEINLPSGVTLTNSTNIPLTICFPNRNLDAYDSVLVDGIAVHQCANCNVDDSIGFICKNPGGISTSTVSVTFASNVSTVGQTVTINGSGMRVTEINTGP